MPGYVGPYSYVTCDNISMYSDDMKSTINMSRLCLPLADGWASQLMEPCHVTLFM